MVNEAALLLEEGIAARPSDVDLVMVNGYGFPNYEGGPLSGRRGRIVAGCRRTWTSSSKLRATASRKGNVAAILDRMR